MTVIFIDGETKVQSRYQVLEASYAGNQRWNQSAGGLSTLPFFLLSPVILMSLAESLSCWFQTFCLVKSQRLLENCDVRVSGSPRPQPWRP